MTSDTFEELQPGKRHSMYIEDFVISIPNLTLQIGKARRSFGIYKLLGLSSQFEGHIPTERSDVQSFALAPSKLAASGPFRWGYSAVNGYLNTEERSLRGKILYGRYAEVIYVERWSVEELNLAFNNSI